MKPSRVKIAAIVAVAAVAAAVDNNAVVVLENVGDHAMMTSPTAVDALGARN